MRPLAVFDVDGVVADVRHRLPYVQRRPKDWKAFFAAAPLDPPLEQGVALARESAKDCEVVYVTGRPERCRRDTLAWFAQHGLPEGELVMRAGRDFRPAAKAKPELLAELAGDRVVAVVVDDDAAVCQAYAALGYRVLRATWADPSATLVRVQEQDGRT